MRASRAFTLVELLVVIAIIAIAGLHADRAHGAPRAVRQGIPRLGGQALPGTAGRLLIAPAPQSEERILHRPRAANSAAVAARRGIVEADAPVSRMALVDKGAVADLFAAMATQSEGVRSVVEQIPGLPAAGPFASDVCE